MRLFVVYNANSVLSYFPPDFPIIWFFFLKGDFRSKRQKEQWKNIYHFFIFDWLSLSFINPKFDSLLLLLLTLIKEQKRIESDLSSPTLQLLSRLIKSPNFIIPASEWGRIMWGINLWWVRCSLPRTLLVLSLFLIDSLAIYPIQDRTPREPNLFLLLRLSDGKYKSRKTSLLEILYIYIYLLRNRYTIN